MKYVETAPPGDLARFVQATWRVEGKPGDVIRVSPDACTDLIGLPSGAFIFNGPMTVAEEVVLENAVTVGVRLRPGCRLVIDEVPCLRSIRDGEVVLEGRISPSVSAEVHLLGFVRRLVEEARFERHPVVDEVLDQIETSVDRRLSLGDIYCKRRVKTRPPAPRRKWPSFRPALTYLADRPRLTIKKGCQNCSKDDGIANPLRRKAAICRRSAVRNALLEGQEYPILSRRRV
jgi:hypothetical protein